MVAFYLTLVALFFHKEERRFATIVGRRVIDSVVSGLKIYVFTYSFYDKAKKFRPLKHNFLLDFH